MTSTIARLVNPWRFKREAAEEARVAELRRRDGEDCRRCRRPIRFDLPAGHDQGPKIQFLSGETRAPDNCCLTHRRCNADGLDVTQEVQDRLRRKNEAELFAKSRRRGKAA